MMMRRRRTERKAKLAAASLFKRVASGRDWSPNSPSVSTERVRQVPARFANYVNLSGGTISKRADRKALSFGNSTVKKDEKVLPKSLPTARNLSQLRRSCRKDGGDLTASDRMVASQGKKSANTRSNPAPKKDTSRQSQVKAGVRASCLVSRQDVKTHKKLDSSSNQDVSRLRPSSSHSSKKTRGSTIEKINDLPKRCNVNLSLSIDILTKPDDRRSAHQCDSASSSKDVILSQKFDILPKICEGQTSQSVLENAPPVVDVKDLFPQVSENCKSTNSTQLNDADITDKRISSDVAIHAPHTETSDLKRNSPLAVYVLPSCEKRNGEFSDSLGVRVSPRKRNLEPVALSEVCVKLTKLDEKSLMAVDQTRNSPRSRKSEVLSSFPSVSCARNLSTWKKRWTPDPAAGNSFYPEAGIDDFLQVIGLVRKSEVRKLEVSPNKLHREAGGKLRRFLKPRLMPEMVYRNGVSMNEILGDHGSDLLANSVGLGSSGLRVGLRSNPGMSTFSAAAESAFPPLEKHQSEKKSSPIVPSRRLAMDKHFVKLEADAVTEATSKGIAGDAGISNLEFSEDKKPDDVTTVTALKPQKSDTAIRTPIKSKYRLRRTSEVKTVATATDARIPEFAARRSTRQMKRRRRAWSHLLRANPDEFESLAKWEPNLKIVSQNTALKLAPQEDVSKNIRASRKDVALKTRSKERSPSTATVAHVDRLRSRASRSTRLLSTRRKLSTDLSLPRGKGKKCTFKEHLKPGKSLTLLRGTQKGNGDPSAENGADSNAGGTEDFDFDTCALRSYRYREADCIVPHMCTVCWVNDHMYCRNMRRTASDLPAFGGCIHYIPCLHYARRSPLTASYRISGGIGRRLEPCATKSAPGVRDGEPRIGGIGRVWRVEDLLCNEEMVDFDSEFRPLSSPGGTEILSVLLHNRGDQIARCLGVDRLPENFDLGRVGSNSATAETVSEETATEVLMEEFAAEVFIDGRDFPLEMQSENSSDSDPVRLENLEAGNVKTGKQSGVFALNIRRKRRNVSDEDASKTSAELPSGVDKQSLDGFFTGDVLGSANEELVSAFPKLTCGKNPISLKLTRDIVGSTKTSLRLLGKAKRTRRKSVCGGSLSPLKYSPRRLLLKNKKRLNEGNSVKSKADVSEKVVFVDANSELELRSKNPLIDHASYAFSAHHSSVQEISAVAACSDESIDDHQELISPLDHSDRFASATILPDASIGENASATEVGFCLDSKNDLLTECLTNEQRCLISDSSTSVMNNFGGGGTISFNLGDQLPGCGVSFGDATTVDPSPEFPVSESWDLQLPMVLESDRTLTTPDVCVLDRTFQKNGSSDVEKRCFSFASAQSGSVSAPCDLRSLEPTNRAAAPACSVVLTTADKMNFKVVTADGATSRDFTLVPISGVLSSLAPNSVPASFSRVFPVVFANCGPLGVVNPISLAVGGSCLPKPAAASSYRTVFPNIAPKTVATTVTQNSSGQKLAPQNFSVLTSPSMAQPTLGCRNVRYVASATIVRKEK